MNVNIVIVLILRILIIDGLDGDKTYVKKDCRNNIEEGGSICTDIEYKSHLDNYDITTIYKRTLVNNDENAFNADTLWNRDAKIHLRTNAIGMPINLEGSIMSSDKKSLEFIADGKYPANLNNIFTQNQIEYNPENWTISTLSMFSGAETPKKFYYDLLLWKANTNEESFKIKWKQRNSIKMCISISYLLEDESKCTLSVELTNGENLKKYIMNAYNIKESKELKTLLIKSNNWLHENETYSINLKLNKKLSKVRMYYDYYIEKNVYKTVDADGCKIGIKRIAQCLDEYENEEILTINTAELEKHSTIVVGVYPFEFSIYGHDEISNSLSSECLNGGVPSRNGCTCPTGFKGKNCEHGCGPNKFGADCTGICSIHQSHCRQMKICTTEFGCKCPTGYSGPHCTEECTNGTYGVNCKQQCPEGCRLKSCDIYTGICNKGECITESYIAPDCKEKYPWLTSPPQLETLDFRSAKLKIDFNSKNIQGSHNVNSMYYQLVFKIASNESEFQYLELKEIGEQKSVIEIMDNLIPGIPYTIGVILVSEDGNYNTEDIKTVNYSTSCLFANSTSYGVKLSSGTDYINVTWNELNDQVEGDCKITEYILKLMYYINDLQKLSYSEEKKSNNNHGYNFENLLPGEKYAIQVTAITAAGLAIPLDLSYIYTEPYVQIKNIKSNLNQSLSMTITWDVDESYAYTPLNFEIKYKVNKHFSCSNKVITNNWTSLLVYNQTRQTISGLISNTQYVIKVEPKIKGYTYDDYSNMIYVKTPISKPTLTPLMNDENSSYITNQSAYFNWKINMTECSKLNGFFRGYQVILKDIVERTQVAKSIKENTVNYNGLKPDTNYELQIYVMTNHGYNLEQGLLIPFKTKTKFLVPVNELIVYKKNLKKKSIGIRWSYPNENDMNGFIVIAIDENLNNTKRIIIEPAERCVAWPKFYCTTFDNLIPNNQYTIKVKAKSLDYPTGGSTSSVVTNFNDGFAGKPENLRTTSVGSTYISLEWGIPYILNGVLKSFIVNIEEVSSQVIEKCCDRKRDVEIPVTEEHPTYNCTIFDLKPGSTYSIDVLSKTSSNGQTSNIHVKTVQYTFVAATGVEHVNRIQLEANTPSNKSNVNLY
ncbi:tenascin-like [Rhopalosiphum maidis]|uniref:tenascin-like n=1 Tax=Rhopalosiphum maidis TaxID=43146 RepID=UPI000EFE1027|nr:tenascin-like [Rhopalosiphum maidis]